MSLSVRSCSAHTQRSRLKNPRRFCGRFFCLSSRIAVRKLKRSSLFRVCARMPWLSSYLQLWWTVCSAHLKRDIQVMGLFPEGVSPLCSVSLGDIKTKFLGERLMYGPVDSREEFIQLAKLCGDPNLVGSKLLEIISTVPLSELSCSECTHTVTHNPLVCSLTVTNAVFDFIMRLCSC